MMGSLLHCLALLSLFASATASGDGKSWCYLSQKCYLTECKEPQNWPNLYDSCRGSFQSPINIITSKVEYGCHLKPFIFENYTPKNQATWTVENNGHTVKVLLDSSAKISAGGLLATYKAVELHFHWGRNGSQAVSPGSEHSIDGERYAMELHIVHMQENLNSMGEAIRAKGLAVLGFFIKEGQNNSNYQHLVTALSNIPLKDSKTKIAALPLSSLIPRTEDLTSYYRYNGSLTTPSCDEAVIWTLFEKPIELSSQQIQEFFKLYFDTTKNSSMVDNFRPVQPLDGRTVYKSDSGAFLPSEKVLLLIPTATYLMLSFLQ